MVDAESNRRRSARATAAQHTPAWCRIRCSHRTLIWAWQHGGVSQILVVEDDGPIRASIRRALAYEGHQVTEAADGQAALDAVSRSRPDLVLLDLTLPNVDGLEVCRRLRAAGDDMPILMVTARDAVDARVLGLDAGADDYLVKPFDISELNARVRALLRRHEPGPERLGVADLTIEVDAMEVTRSGRRVDLTTLEFRLLEYLVRNARIVLSRDRILSDVWGLDVDTTSNIVDVYIGYLRSKTEAGGDPRLIHTVRGAGYVVREEP